MGPVAAIAVIGGGAAIIANQDDDHVHVDNFMGSHNIGGRLTQVQRTQELRQSKTVTKEELDQYLRGCGLPEDKIVEAQKLKIANIGAVESLEFLITESQFAGRLIVVKSRKTAANQIQLLVCKERIEAKYEAPQIQSNYSSSGARYSARPLDGTETAALTSAVRDKAKEVGNELKKIAM